MRKYALAIHDLSCYGKCALSIVVPVLSAMDVETTPLPTAVLSTHTGGLGKPHICDLTDDLLPILQHWKTLNLSFDAIYSGYLASLEQLDIIKTFFEAYPDSLHFVDPVMGDHGRLYSSMDPAFPKYMKTLCQKADIVTPNMTEAYALLSMDYQEGPYTKKDITDIVYALRKMCQADIVLTGVYFDELTIGAAVLGKDEEDITYIQHTKVAGAFHGTGDLFSSILLGALLHKKSLAQAVDIAARVTAMCIKKSNEEQEDERKGLHFEFALHQLYDEMKRED